MIGWLFIGFGALALFSGVMVAIASVMMPMPARPPAKMFDAPLPLQWMSRAFEYFTVIAAIQIIVAATMVWSGAAFLRLERWSRTVLEIITWLALTYVIAFGAFWLWTAASMWSVAPSDAGPMNLAFPLFLAVGAMMIVGMAVPLVVIIRVLRGATVRGAFLTP